LNTLNISVVKELLSTKKKILITSHSNPDGDALGSGLAMMHFLNQFDHEVNFLVPNLFPDFLSWMPGNENILIIEKEKKRCYNLIESADILFSLDYNSPSRLGEAGETFKNARGIKILIDHHIDPDLKEYDHVLSTVDTSSTSELVYDLITEIDASKLNLEIAECLYAGIMTDTGSFSFACNYEKTFRIVAELYKLGMDGVKINRLVYNTYSESRLRLLGYALSEKLVVLQEYATAYISLTMEELDKYNYKVGDTEGLVNYALSIKGIKLAALFTEKKKKIRISFRSVGDFSVNKLAGKYYEGGGHKNAAGGDSFVPMEETLKQFERLLSEYKEELV
jgi:phosphoesterase RecJ-like protein